MLLMRLYNDVATVKNNWWLLNKLIINLPYDPAILLQYTKKKLKLDAQAKTHKHMFAAALLRIAKR